MSHTKLTTTCSCRGTEALLDFAKQQRQTVFAGLQKSDEAEKPIGTVWFTKAALMVEKKKSRRMAEALKPFLTEDDDDAEMETDEPAAKGVAVEKTSNESPRSTTDPEESDANKKPAANDQPATGELKISPEDDVVDSNNAAAEMSESAPLDSFVATPDSFAAPNEAVSTPAPATADGPPDGEMDLAAAIAAYAVQSPGEGDDKKNKRRRVQK